ncbi:hypothetical protein N0V91_005552 [Didymella pomorum]|jgi:hypothetical protein|uniref:Uncharacterized protein n=1 Tax=Didymella pomorum TaxID=749634 RepID=A0A9W9D757_9PLEO|nr:hypothetical protein N0V91_005552 [Didymella pomorum]
MGDAPGNPNLLPAGSHATHNRQQFSRNQLLRYLLLAGTFTLAISIWALQLRHTSLPISLSTHPTFSAPSITSSTTSDNYPRSRIGKLTACFGPLDPIYQAAIASHLPHNELHGNPHCILREHMIRGLWAKHGFLLTVLGAELSKPADQRPEWLMWHDRDVAVMNPQIPLNMFPPPEGKFGHVNLVVAKE